ncbi:hypothetical protein [Mycolicibacterium sp. HK-90]|uniref:hypothetical protein n=1 Tax=Mycolicibacterium sp. HK-90 TaxID=3056937 RepID=UPI002658C4B3|nr:hypothetical protein [Mycolicibacterium sp. HK-90]WKG05637.1 hypothetical protein QU592_11400 [Mycolicibacterium sp. HK-90]
MTTSSPPINKLWKRRNSTDANTGSHTGASEVSVAKIAMMSAIATALIGAVPTVIDMVNGDPGPVTIPMSERQSNDRVFVDDPILSDSGRKLSISGTADPFVEAVGVMLTDPKAHLPIFTATTNVTDGKWNVVATSDHEIPQPLEVKAYYKERAATGAGIMKTSYAFRLDPPSPPPSPQPGQQTGCAAQNPDGCFSGPGWGPPSIYRTDS